MAPKPTTSRSQERVYVLAYQTSICAGGALSFLHLGDLLLKMMRVDGTVCSCEPMNQFECPLMLFFYPTFFVSSDSLDLRRYERTTHRLIHLFDRMTFQYKYRQ